MPRNLTPEAIRSLDTTPSTEEAPAVSNLPAFTDLEDCVATPSGAVMPAWFHRMQPAIEAAYRQRLENPNNAHPGLQLDAAKDLMDRGFGKPVQPTVTKVTETRDVRVQHLHAVQRRSSRDVTVIEGTADDDPFA